MTLTKQELKYIAVSLMNTATHIDTVTRNPFNTDGMKQLHERVKEEIASMPGDDATLPLPLDENKGV